MALDAIFRKGVQIIDKIVKPMQVPVKHYIYSGQTQDGTATYLRPILRYAVYTPRAQDRPGGVGQITRVSGHLQFTKPFTETGGAPDRVKPLDPRDKFRIEGVGDLDPIVETLGVVDPTTLVTLCSEVWLGQKVVTGV